MDLLNVLQMFILIRTCYNPITEEPKEEPITKDPK